jgi:superfamily II DNA or RNA helicase
VLSTNQNELCAASETPPTLRYYQQNFILDIYAQIRAGIRRILGFSPTGSGKTVLAAQVAAHAASKNKRVLFVVHRETLIAQTADKLSSFGLNDCGFIKSGWQENRKALVQIASVQTLERRDWWQELKVDIVILDEAHLTAFAAIVTKMMAEIFPQAIYLGLTATPWRLSKKESLGDIFERLVAAPMPHELISSGFLVKPDYFSPNQADLEKVGTAVNGDFNEGQLALACDRQELSEQMVRDWHNLAFARRTIAFTVNVAHARNLADAFMEAGIPSAYVDGKMPYKSVEQIYQQLADGELMILCSCMKLTEGFDLPSTSAIILARPTKSKALHFQMIGRGLRLSPETNKTDCIVIDIAGNVMRHGFVEDIKEISMEPGYEGTGGDEAPKKICPIEQKGCGKILYAFMMKCPECGYVFEQPKKVYLVPGLEQLLSESDIERYEFYRQSLRSAYDKNFAPGWAAMTFKERYGYWSPNSWSKGAIFGTKPTPEQQSNYLKYLQAIAQRKEKPLEWVQKQMELEFGLGQVTQSHLE